MSLAIYPGSFDPFTLGHLDIVQRALKVFGNVCIAIGKNTEKDPLFSPLERQNLILESTRNIQGIQVDIFDGLLVEFAKQKKAHVLLRGLRALSDFDYEFQLAGMNRHLDASIETIFMMTSDKYFYVSSKMVRAGAFLGADIEKLVPAPVYEALLKKVGKK